MDKTIAPWEQEYELLDELHQSGKDLVKEIANIFTQYVDLPEKAERLLALWVLHTYTIHMTRVNPLLYIYSPQMRCGKSTLLSVLNRLVNRPMQVSGMSSAALYRSVEKWRPTLLLDEADSFLKAKSESAEALRGIINSCWTRESAFKSVCVGKSHSVTAFPTYTPIAIAGIGNLEKAFVTIADRSIVIKLQRKLNTKKLSRLTMDDDSLAYFDFIRQQCHTWADQKDGTVGGYQQMDADWLEAMDDRTRDNYEVLNAIARTCFLERKWLKQAYEANKYTSESENIDSQLLNDIYDYFVEKKEDFAPTNALINYLCEKPERPWSTWSRGSEISAYSLARKLKDYEIKPNKKRQGTHVVRGYFYDDNFKKQLGRYCQVDI